MVVTSKMLQEGQTWEFDGQSITLLRGTWCPIDRFRDGFWIASRTRIPSNDFPRQMPQSDGSYAIGIGTLMRLLTTNHAKLVNERPARNSMEMFSRFFRPG